VSEAHDAEDVAQETWRRALERPPAHEGNLRRWLAAVARNVARAFGRERAARARHEDRAAAGGRAGLAAAPSATAAASAAAEATERAELHRRVVSAVLALSELYRGPLLLRFFDDLPATDVARRLGIPVETARTRIKRGLEQLRTKLAADFAQEGRSERAALTTLAGGAWIMAKATKIGLAAAALVVAAAGVAPILLRTSRPTRAEDDSSARNPAVAEAATAPSSNEVPVPTERAAVAESRGASTLSAPSATSARTGTIRGIVVDVNGAPVAGATVYCGEEHARGFESRRQFFSDVNSNMPADRTRPWTSTTTTADGTFSFEGLDPFFRWSAGAAHPVEGFGFASPIAFGPQALEREVEIPLEGGVSIAGSLTDPDGEPFLGGLVMVYMRATPAGSTPWQYEDLAANLRIQRDGSFAMLPASFRWYPASTAAPPETGYAPAAQEPRARHQEAQLPPARPRAGRGRKGVTMAGERRRVTRFRVRLGEATCTEGPVRHEEAGPDEPIVRSRDGRRSSPRGIVASSVIGAAASRRSLRSVNPGGL
jgi:RNA polymerase sigma-70 factor (ECF subfamily)